MQRAHPKPNPDLVEIAEQACDIGPLTSSLGFLTRVIQLQMRDFVRAAGREDLSLAAYSALATIGQNPGIRQGLLATALLIQESNMTALVRQLTDMHLVARRPIARQGRATGLWLTEKGQKLIAKITPRMQGVDRAFAESLSEEEYATAISILRRLFLERLTDYPTPSPVPARAKP